MFFEYLTKGLTLGVLGYLGWKGQLGASVWVYGLLLLGLILAVLLAHQRTCQLGIKSQSWTLTYFSYLLLEYPRLVFTGVLAGLLVGYVGITIVWPGWHELDLVWAIGIGLVLGLLLLAIRTLAQNQLRRWAVLALGAAVIAGFVLYLYRDHFAGVDPKLFGLHLLLAIPIFYLLTIAGRIEETEIEIGLICVLLGLALWVMLGPSFQLMAMLIPLVIYMGYTQYLLKNMQAFKNLLHGMGHARQGSTIEALTSLKRALQYAPASPAARQELWKVHRQIDLRQVHQDPRLLQLIDFELCLQRARQLLFAEMVSPEQVAEAKQLLDLVLDQRPALRPAVLYYRAVADTHRGEYEKAASSLLELLEGKNFGPEEANSRATVLVPAWQLALLQHRELRQRVGEPLLAQGKRMAAIADLEQASTSGEDLTALKKKLYADVTLAEYQREAGQELTQKAAYFDHKWVYEQGLELLEDPTRYERGIELLAIAVRGQPRHAPAVWKIAADAAEKHNNPALARQAWNEIKAWTRLLGLSDISAESKAAYFATVKRLGEEAYGEAVSGKPAIETAIENLLLSTEAAESGLETLKMLADLYEMKGDLVQTMHFNEQCILYDSKNKQFQERKERLYYSLTPALITQHSEKLSKLLDLSYLTRKPKELLENKQSGTEQLNWARHLAELLTVAAPERVSGWTLIGRAFLRLQQPQNGVKALEYAYQLGLNQKPSGEDLDSWYLACRILGDYYLGEHRYEDALECYQHFIQSTKSGADTYYKMGQAAEALGDKAKARKHYQSANMFDHPQKYEVSQALARVS